MKQEQEFTEIVSNAADKLAADIKKHALNDFIKFYKDSGDTHEQTAKKAREYFIKVMSQELTIELTKIY